MSEEVIFTWRRAGVMCRPYLPRRGLGPDSWSDAPHHIMPCRAPSCSSAVAVILRFTSGYFDLLLQLELHTSPPTHMFMTNYIVPADHTVSIMHQRVAESGVAM